MRAIKDDTIHCMESRVRMLVLAAAVPMVLLIVGIAYWLYVSLNAPAVVGPEPTAPPAATAAPTLTPTSTNTPVVVVIPTVPPPPTSTPSPTVVSTRTAVPTAVPSATSTRAPVRAPTSTPTDTPAPTNTPPGGQYPYRIESGPTLISNRACVSQNIVFGWIKDRNGSGLPNMRLRLMPKYGNPPELPAVTRSGAEAGYYELTLGASANEWDIWMVDENDIQISPSARFTLLQVESGQCWWQLMWVQR
jgi:hypothetical protein